MIFTSRNKLKSSLLLALCAVSLSVTGFSAWQMVQDSSKSVEDVNVDIAPIVNFSNFVTNITEDVTNLKMGVYSFTSETGKLNFGELTYFIDFDAYQLPYNLKENKTDDKYDITIYGTLSLATPINIFTSDYVDSLKVDNENSENNILIFNNDYTKLSFSFRLLLTPIYEYNENNPVLETHKVTFLFKHKMVQDFRENGLDENSFIFELSTAAYIAYPAEDPND